MFSKNECELVVVPNDLTDKFQLPDITIKQKARKFVSHKFNTWYEARVSNQLKRGLAPGNVKVSLQMSYMKPLHACWIAEM